MDKRSRKELIDGIRDSLRDYREPYDRSEWEHFQQRRKNRHRKPIPLFIKLAGVAASLFLMVYASVRFLPFSEADDAVNKTIPKEVPRPLAEEEQEAVDTLTADSIVPTDTPKISETARVPEAQIGIDQPSGLIPGEETNIHGAYNGGKIAAPIENVETLAHSIAIGRPLKAGSLQTASLRVHFPNLEAWVGNRMSANNINIGFNVTPAFTNKGFSFTGGLSAQFPLSRKVAAEIGVSYMNLKVGKDMKADRTDTVGLQTVGIRYSVGMVAIPVSLNYAFTENFSGTLGLVPFWVMKDQRTDIHQSYRWVSGDMLSGDTTRRLVGERTRSQRDDSLYTGNTYLGFVQVSGRYSPPFLKKRNMVIAPFVAVPVGRLRDDEYRWTHAGVSIRLYLR